MSALDVARAYAGKGWNPVPLSFRSKRPTDDDWQSRVVGPEDVGRLFNGGPMNIGVQLGPTSGGLVDVDLDCPEAIMIAPAVLPPTRAIFGRASARGSHRLYYSATLAATIDKATLQFKDPTREGNKASLLEIRVGGGGKGAQTVFPGSTHEDTGESIVWEEDGEPAPAGDDLVRRAKLTAALCLLARYWPGDGARHDAALTIGGFLARCGFKLPMVKLYAEFVARAAMDEESHDRVRAAADSTIAYQKGEKARGYPALKEMFGDKVADRVADWLEYQGSRDESAAQLEHLERLPIVATPYVWAAAESMPARQWLYGRRLLRQIVSATVAPGGVGKTSLVVAEALAMVSGKMLLGILPPAPLRVWLWNLEEPLMEMQRQIAATAKLFGLAPDDIADRLFVDTSPLVIATTTRDKATVIRPVTDGLVAEIKRRRIDVLTIDPFVSCHELTENDNKHIDLVAKEWKRVAEAADCSIELVHHVRKGEAEITAESSRGGGAFVDTCRNVRVLNRMSKDEGDKARVANHRLYFRTFSDKANKVPPAEKSDWFKLESVDLCNAPPGASDLIGVPRRWEWPDAMAGISAADFDKVAAAIRAGRWREHPQAAAWVGYAVAGALGLDAADQADRLRIQSMLKVWLAAGSLVRVEGEDEKRMKRTFVTVRDDAP